MALAIAATQQFKKNFWGVVFTPPNQNRVNFHNQKNRTKKSFFKFVL